MRMAVSVITSCAADTEMKQKHGYEGQLWPTLQRACYLAPRGLKHQMSTSSTVKNENVP